MSPQGKALTGRLALAVSGLGCALLAWAGWRTLLQPPAGALLWLVGAGILLELFPAPLTAAGSAAPRGSVSGAGALAYAAVLVAPLPHAVVAGAVISFGGDLALRRKARETFFNAGQAVLVAAAGAVAAGTVALGAGPPAWERAALAGLVMAVAGSVLTGTVLGLADGRGLAGRWHPEWTRPVLLETAVYPLGAAAALLCAVAPATVLLLVPPLAALQAALRHLGALRVQSVSLLEAVADAVDKRDPHTFHHGQRVGSLAEGVARRLGLPEREVACIRLAGRLHDLGKVAWDRGLDRKPGPLTVGERLLVERHPVLGAELLARLPALAPCSVHVRHHHERYDGRGYPDGLAGRDIPLGARILAAADAYDALISDRPYRAALSCQEALARLRQGAGRQFDPRVVDALAAVVAGTPPLGGSPGPGQGSPSAAPKTCP